MRVTPVSDKYAEAVVPPRRGFWKCFDVVRRRGPSAVLLLLFYAAYVLTGGLGQGMALIPGVAITFWPPAGVFLATLLANPKSGWPWWLLCSAQDRSRLWGICPRRT